MRKNDQLQNLFFQTVWRIEHLRHLAFLSSSSIQRQYYKKLIEKEMMQLVQLNIEIWEREKEYRTTTVVKED